MHTEFDAQIVSWIGGVGPAGAEHVAGRFGRGRSRTYECLLGLVESGFLVHHRLLHQTPGLYVASARGLRWRGLERYGVARLGAGGFEHAWQVASAAVALQVGLPGWRVLGEHALRAVEFDEGELFASVLVGESPSGRAVLHRPDLALISPWGEVWAIEVELTVKSGRRLRAICNGFARARYLQGICYLAVPKTQRVVRRALAEVHGEDRVTVLALEQAGLLAETLRTGGLR